jgi:hypothetical protein
MCAFVRGTFLTSPLAPRGEICSLGEMFTSSFTPRGEHSLLLRRMEGQTENSTPGGQLRRQGTKFTSGVTVCSRGEVKNGRRALHTYVVVSFPAATEGVGAMGREIESQQGMGL